LGFSPSFDEEPIFIFFSLSEKEIIPKKAIFFYYKITMFAELSGSANNSLKAKFSIPFVISIISYIFNS
jgi:hypothetical protein